jgi:hypothetical protein
MLILIFMAGPGLHGFHNRAGQKTGSACEAGQQSFDDQASMIAHQKLRFSSDALQRCELSQGRRNLFTRYVLCCKGTACDIGKPFLIIPRISGVAESPNALLPADFPEMTVWDAPEQNPKGLKIQRGESE